MNDVLWSILRERKISQYRLSKDTGIPQTTISEWKAGRQPNAEKLSIIAKYLGVSVDCLLGEETKKPAIDEDDELRMAEAEFIKVWRLVPEERQKMLKDMIIADLKSKGLL